MRLTAADRDLPGYAWIRDTKPVCGWCGWTPPKLYPSIRRAQEGMQGHEANSKYGCKEARIRTLDRGLSPEAAPQRERLRRQTKRTLARTKHGDRAETMSLNTYRHH